MAFDMTQNTTHNGVEFEPQDYQQSLLLVHGVEPTEFEKYLYCNVLVQHKNVKETESYHAGGNAQGSYLYAPLEDIVKFHEKKYPYYLPVVTVKIANKKGEMKDMIIHADFDKIQELQLVPRNAPQAKPAAPAAPKA